MENQINFEYGMHFSTYKKEFHIKKIKILDNETILIENQKKIKFIKSKMFCNVDLLNSKFSSFSIILFDGEYSLEGVYKNDNNNYMKARFDILLFNENINLNHISELKNFSTFTRNQNILNNLNEDKQKYIINNLIAPFCDGRLIEDTIYSDFDNIKNKIQKKEDEIKMKANDIKNKIEIEKSLNEIPELNLIEMEF